MKNHLNAANAVISSLISAVIIYMFVYICDSLLIMSSSLHLTQSGLQVDVVVIIEYIVGFPIIWKNTDAQSSEETAFVLETGSSAAGIIKEWHGFLYKSHLREFLFVNTPPSKQVRESTLTRFLLNFHIKRQSCV